MKSKELKLGVFTTHEVKWNSMVATRTRLSKDEIRFADCFVTQHEKPEVMLGEFKRQMLTYRETRKRSKDEFGVTRRAWSGKLTRDTRDDMAVCLQLGINYKDEFWTNVIKYGQYHN